MAQSGLVTTNGTDHPMSLAVLTTAIATGATAWDVPPLSAIAVGELNAATNAARFFAPTKTVAHSTINQQP